MTNRIMVATVFLAGCAVGGVSSQLVVPKASAQQAATTTAWEYKCIEAFRADLQSGATRLGNEHWELVAAGFNGAASEWCFKRPKM